MKQLVLYCRWQRARLYLHGRSAKRVWGELEGEDGSRCKFRYDLMARELVLDKGSDEEAWQLDEMGVAKPSRKGGDESPGTAS